MDEKSLVISQHQIREDCLKPIALFAYLMCTTALILSHRIK